MGKRWQLDFVETQNAPAEDLFQAISYLGNTPPDGKQKELGADFITNFAETAAVSPSFVKSLLIDMDVNWADLSTGFKDVPGRVCDSIPGDLTQPFFTLAENGSQSPSLTVLLAFRNRREVDQSTTSTKTNLNFIANVT